MMENKWSNNVTRIVAHWWMQDILEYKDDIDSRLDTLHCVDFVKDIISADLDTTTVEGAFIADLVVDSLDCVDWVQIANAANNGGQI